MKENSYGLIIAIVVALISLGLAHILPIGSVAIAIIVGIVVGNSIKIPKICDKGITYAEKTLLAYAIGLMGINLDFSILVSLGFKSILLIIVGMVITIFSALFFGKLFGIDKKFALLLGIGNGVCGSSAIAATKDIIGVDKDKVGISVAVVNFLGTVGIFLVPFIGAFIFSFSDINNGILVGNTLQAVGQVLAGGFSISDVAGQTATIIKMGRVLLLTPLIFILIYIFKNQNNTINSKVTNQIPGFIIVFVVLSIVATTNILPTIIIDILSSMSHYFLLIAMSAIGLKISFKTILTHGSSALKIGSFIFMVQILFSSLVLIFI